MGIVGTFWTTSKSLGVFHERQTRLSITQITGKDMESQKLRKKLIAKINETWSQTNHVVGKWGDTSICDAQT